MPKTKDDSLKTKEGTYTIKRKTKGGTYQSQLKASQKWESENPKDKILFRVPEGKKKEIEDYVKAKAEEHKQDGKYTACPFTSYNGKGHRPSINAYLIYLIEQDSGIDLS